jgi:hypothetical protein
MKEWTAATKNSKITIDQNNIVETPVPFLSTTGTALSPTTMNISILTTTTSPTSLKRLQHQWTTPTTVPQQ